MNRRDFISKTATLAGVAAMGGMGMSAFGAAEAKAGFVKGGQKMKTIRLLYPDFVSGGLDDYYFGANLLQHILPANPDQPLLRVPVKGPDGRKFVVTDGVTGREEVEFGLRSAQQLLADAAPDKVITIGGNCFVSLAPFDYLRGKYKNLGVLWIDAHPDVSTPKDGYPFAHAMVLGSLLGNNEAKFASQMKNAPFAASDVMYVGLQGLHDYQKKFLDEKGVAYKIQEKSFVTNDEITDFVKRFNHVVVHFDIDVLDEHFFHSTYFANPDAGGDGAGGGRMKTDRLGEILRLIEANADLVGLTIAEYLPFDEYRLHKELRQLNIFKS